MNEWLQLLIQPNTVHATVSLYHLSNTRAFITVVAMTGSAQTLLGVTVDDCPREEDDELRRIDVSDPTAETAPPNKDDFLLHTRLRNDLIFTVFQN